MRIRVLILAAIVVPLAIPIQGAAQGVTNFNVTNSGASAYVVDGVNNATLTLTRGRTYTFTLSASGHPFWITTARGAAGAAANQFSTGVTNNGIAAGTITFVVPSSAPAALFYQCSLHDAMGGSIGIVSPPVPGVGRIALIGLVALILAAGLVALRRRARA
jgi:hypothetical protein